MTLLGVILYAMGMGLLWYALCSTTEEPAGRWVSAFLGFLLFFSGPFLILAEMKP